MIDRMEAESRLAEIQARRTILFDQHRSATLPEPELFEQLRRLDSEENFWRLRLKQEEQPPPPALPAWGKELWTTVLGLSADVDAWRDERRQERIEDGKDRDRARRIQYTFFVALAVWMSVLTIALLWFGAEVWRMTELWR